MLLDDDDVDDADATARKARYLAVDNVNGSDDGAARTRKISSFRIL